MQKSILDLNSKKLKEFSYQVFSTCFDHITNTSSASNEEEDGVKMKDSSYIDYVLQNEQRRSVTGQLFWGPSKCNNCQGLLRYVSKSCIICGKATAISEWKGRGKLGPAVEEKLLAALRLPKGSKLGNDKNLNKGSVNFSPSLTPKKFPDGAPKDFNDNIPELNMESASPADEDDTAQQLDNFFDVDQTTNNNEATGQNSLFGNFKVASSPVRNTKNDVFSTFIGMDSNTSNNNNSTVDLLSQTLADFGISDSSNSNEASANQSNDTTSETVANGNNNNANDGTDDSGLNSVLEVIRSTAEASSKSKRSKKKRAAKTQNANAKYPEEIQALIDALQVPIHMLSSALALPLNRRHSTLSTASSQDDNSIISADMMATTENDNANDFGDSLATNNGVNNAAEIEGGTQLEKGVDIAIDNNESTTDDFGDFATSSNDDKNNNDEVVEEKNETNNSPMDDGNFGGDNMVAKDDNNDDNDDDDDFGDFQ